METTLIKNHHGGEVIEQTDIDFIPMSILTWEELEKYTQFPETYTEEVKAELRERNKKIKDQAEQKSSLSLQTQ